jgi:hypothetical protein
VPWQERGTLPHSIGPGWAKTVSARMFSVAVVSRTVRSRLPVEQRDGRFEVLTPSDFRKRVAQAARE